MIALASRKYLLLREAASLAGVSAKVLRGQVSAGRIPERFLLRSGDVRPVVRIHRSWLERSADPAPAIVATAVFPWGERL